MATQPRFKRGKVYDGRRGRRTYQIESIFSDGHGNHQYSVVVHMGKQDWVTRFWEDELLEVARLTAKSKNETVLSASQISKFKRCKRAWAYVYINGETEPSNLNLVWGLELHKVLEDYLRTGEWEGADDAIRCAQQGLHVLPDAPVSKGVEQPINILVAAKPKIRIVGFIDLVLMRTHPVVIDHKTTKDLRWAKTQDDLREDDQANIYGKWALDNIPEADAVAVLWSYYCSRPSKAKTATADGRPRIMGGHRPVRRLKTREEVEHHWQLITEVGKEMASLSRDHALWARDIEENPDACWDYGGCPFKHICPVKQESLGGLFEKQHIAHLPKGGDKTAEETMGSLMDIINASKNKTQEEKPREEAPAQAQEAEGINPPASEKQELPAALVEASKPQIPQTWIDRFNKGHKPRNDEEKAWRAEQEKKALDDAPAEGEAVMEVTEEPKKQVEEHEEKQKEQEPASEQPSSPQTAGMFILCVDCAPLKDAGKTFSVTTLAEVLRPMKDAVQKMKEVPYWNMIKYREGETLLAACTEEALKKDKPAGIVIADSSSGEWKACGDVLTELADVVLRGVAV